MKMSEEKKPSANAIQYCAGLFDAEGSIGYYKRKGWEKFKPELAIQMAHKPTVDFFAATMKAGSVTISKREGKKDMFRWRVSGERDIQEIASMLLPDLIIKDEEMRYLVEALDSKFEKQQSYALALSFLKHTSFFEGTDLLGTNATRSLTCSYVAGFLDGDGSFEPVNIARNSVRVSSANCCPSVLVLLMKKFGGAVRLNRKQAGNRRASWKWTVCGKQKVLRLLDEIQPQLIEKAEVAKLARVQCEKESDGRGPKEKC